MPLDVEKLLAPVSPDAPCGEDLTYDPAYLELERIAQGTAEQQVGSTVVAAQEPNWRDVRTAAEGLLARTKDLRVVLYLTLAALKLEGVAGMRDGLALLRGVLERYWDGACPKLDPSDGFDPLERMNILSSLSPVTEVYGDPMQFKKRLREAPLCRSKQLGAFALRDVLMARGELAPAAGEKAPPEMSMIEGAFQDAETEALQGTATAGAEALSHLEAIDAALTRRVGAGKAPNLVDLRQMLQQIAAVTGEYLARRGAGVAPAAAAGTEQPAKAAPGAAGPSLSGAVNSPEDVLRAFDKICEYYQRCEPSSPVPLLVKRARRLVRKSFLEIIQDLNPQGMPQIEVISGPAEQPGQGR